MMRKVQKPTVLKIDKSKLYNIRLYKTVEGRTVDFVLSTVDDNIVLSDIDTKTKYSIDGDKALCSEHHLTILRNGDELMMIAPNNYDIYIEDTPIAV